MTLLNGRRKGGLRIVYKLHSWQIIKTRGRAY